MTNLKLELDLDFAGISDRLEKAEKLEDNELLFGALAMIDFEKRKLAAANEAFEAVEREVKQKINDKANALYGTNWAAIKGNGYKITKSSVGSVYTIVGQTGEDFVEVKLAPKTKAINDFVKAHSTLPEGIEYNPNRGESIRITVKPNGAS
jgi:hypothetical protein